MKKRILLKIEGMECPNCSMKLEQIEDRLPGVISAEASYRKAQMVVEFDDAKLSEEALSAEIVRLGYQVLNITPMPS
jgi:copper chaperone CopZ